MRIKSYFAGSVEQAIQQARQELGMEAMLITSRRSSPESRHLGAYEVVFGVQAANAAIRSAAPADLSGEMQVLRAQLEDIKRVLQVNNARSHSDSAEIDGLYRDLLDADLDSAIARQIADETLDIWQTTPAAQRSLAGGELLRALASDALRKRLRFAPEFAGRGQDSRIVVFAGPPGAGKTTTLTKIAIQKCLAGQLSLRIISVDPQRVGSHEKLRTFAGILGTGFTAASTIREFLDAVEEYRTKNFLLIDTPGLAAADADAATDLAGCLRNIPRKEIHLVLPASMKRADLSRCIRRFEALQPDYLLFTKLDETESFGGIVSAAIESGKPLSFTAGGQSIPEDLAEADAATLLDALFHPERTLAISAA